MPFDYKKATIPELFDEYDRISMASGSHQVGASREASYLPNVLAEGEQVIALCSGAMEGRTWLMALTGGRLLLLNKGHYAGLRLISVHLGAVVSVECVHQANGTIVIELTRVGFTLTGVPRNSAVSFTRLLSTQAGEHCNGSITERCFGLACRTPTGAGTGWDGLPGELTHT